MQRDDASILDLVKDSAASVKREGSASDRVRLDEYFESVRSVEHRLEAAMRPQKRWINQGKFPLDRPAPGTPPTHAEHVKLMLDIFMLAFWTDTTRIGTFMLGDAQIERGLLVAARREAASSTRSRITPKTRRGRMQYGKIVDWHIEQVAYLLNRLKSLDEGGTSLLDNSMVMFGGSLKDGNRHTVANLPLILAGRGKGTHQAGAAAARAGEDAVVQPLSLDAAPDGDSREVVRRQHGTAGRARVRRATLLLAAAGACFGADPAQEFAQSIKPVLVENCGACHTRGSANFLAKALETDRGLWRSVSAQLRNRTMPPVDSKLSEGDRLRVAQWIDGRLRATACSAGDNAGASPIRRLNRREYRNTIRDLIGLDLDLAALFPADGTGGAGFDTNGDTLYIQPLLMERYLQSAQQILDRAIVTPKLVRTGSGTQAVAIYADGTYTVRSAAPAGTKVEVDGADAGALAPLRGRNANMSAAQVKLERGTHEIALAGAWTLEEQRAEPSAEKRALHYRLLGSEPGEEPLDARKTARRVLASFLPKAYRRPVQAAEIDRLLQMYDRAAERGDPYEERVKLALKAALVSPDFLFRMERRHTAPGIHPVGQYEMASRLAYFLWSTMPDETLLTLAREGRLQDPKVLAEQVERMLDDPRSRTFTTTFIGQWLGTQEIGGRVHAAADGNPVVLQRRTSRTI